MTLRIFLLAPSDMLTDHRPHGDGLVAFGFIRELAARGHELHVAAGRVDLRETLPPNVHIYPLGRRQEPAKEARLPFMWRVRRLHRRLTRSSTLDVIHQLVPVEVGVSLALADAPEPVVLGPYVPSWAASGEGADQRASRDPLQVKRILRAAQQRRATTVLLSTPAAASKLEPRAGGRVLVRELPPGIDESVWLPANADGDGQVVLFLANLEVRKGIHVVLDAFERLTPDMPDARLLVGGDGPEMEAVRRRIRASRALGRVELLGHIHRDETVATMRSCDVYCLPSYQEPFGLTALEAMACAKPIVATDAGGLRHLVPDQGGRRVRPGDGRALAAALQELLGCPRLRREMGQHNRRVVEERYSWRRVVDRLEDAYGETLRRRRPPTGTRPAGGTHSPAPGHR